jgi:hypothetical protein
MNERIKQLAEQAGLNDAYMNFDHKYFAQLIVRECMKVSNLSLSKHELPSDKIAEHFGVTE